MKDLRKIVQEQIKEIFNEDYPLGAEQDSNAPWADEELPGENITSYHSNFETGNFMVMLDDGQELFIDFEPIIEKYFKLHPGSHENFDLMFPMSNNIYSDIVKYLTGQGHNFKSDIQDEVDYLVSSGEIENSGTKDFEKAYDTKTDLYGNSSVVNSAIDEEKAERRVKDIYVIYKETETDKPPYKKTEVVDFADNEEEAIKKGNQYIEDNEDPSVIEFFYERPKAINHKFHLNEAKNYIRNEIRKFIK